MKTALHTLVFLLSVGTAFAQPVDLAFPRIYENMAPIQDSTSAFVYSSHHINRVILKNETDYSFNTALRLGRVRNGTSGKWEQRGDSLFFYDEVRACKKADLEIYDNVPEERYETISRTFTGILTGEVLNIVSVSKVVKSNPEVSPSEFTDWSDLTFAQNFRIQNSPSVNEVRRVKNPNIRFEWTLGDTTELGKNHLIVLHYSITNLSEDTINYLCQSCNHLDYYLHPRPNHFSVSPNFHCNASWAVIRKLAPGETLDATTRLMRKPTDTKTAPLKIGLDFMAVDRFIPFEELKKDEGPVEKLYRGKIDWDQVIWKELE
ncbi:MAG: hypothetical protein SchgKO_10740 [Schleiferiaceae bacterium]